MGKSPHRAVVDLEATPGQFGHKTTQGEGPVRHPGTQPVRLFATDLARHVPADLARRSAARGPPPPVARRRCDHFTTLDGATLRASATSRTVWPASSRAIARSRISIERGFVMKAGLHTQPPS